MLPVHPFGDVAIILVTNEHFRRFAARAILFCQLDGGTEGLGFAWNSYLAEKTGKFMPPAGDKGARRAAFVADVCSARGRRRSGPRSDRRRFAFLTCHRLPWPLTTYRDRRPIAS